MNAFIPQELFAELWTYKNNWVLEIPYPAHVKEFTIPTTGAIVSDQFIITGTSGTKFCDQINSTQITADRRDVNAGPIHVSFIANQSVNFWILDQTQYSAWRKTPTCSGRLGTPSILTLADRSNYDNFTIQIPKTDTYYFVFDNSNLGPVSVRFEADYPNQANTP
jgi:hypothetical protein